MSSAARLQLLIGPGVPVPVPRFVLDAISEVKVESNSGETQSGPRFVAATGIEIIASGPALCSPLNGVGVATLKPQGAASLGMLNQKPTWNVCG